MEEAPRRFFVDPSVLGAPGITLTGDIAHRLARVLRYRPGDQLILTAGNSTEYLARLDTISPKAITATVVSEQPGPPEPAIEIVLYQSLIRPNRFDIAIEKGTEVGVSRFVPVINARSQVQTEEPSAARSERWRRLITEAAEQCGRGRLPEIAQPARFEEAIYLAPGLRILPWEHEREQKLADYLRTLPEPPTTISVFIGPEGGYTEGEIELARTAGAAPVTLGRQVLRSETAAIVATGIILHELM